MRSIEAQIGSTNNSIVFEGLSVNGEVGSLADATKLATTIFPTDRIAIGAFQPWQTFLDSQLEEGVSDSDVHKNLTNQQKLGLDNLEIGVLGSYLRQQPYILTGGKIMSSSEFANLSTFEDFGGWTNEGSVTKRIAAAQLTQDTAMAAYIDGRLFLPYLPNHSLEDRVGMRYAVQVLHTSLRPGVYAENIQFETLRKTETWVSNMHDAGAAYSTAQARDGDARDNDYRSTSPTRGRWFRRFMRGVKLRMGQIRYQNEPLTPGIILGLDAIITAEWMNTTDQAHKEKLEELMCFILIGFGCSLRGEEVPLVSLRGLNKFWDETWAADDPYIMITLYGRFKGETGFRWHCLPISDLSRSRLPFRKWISTLLQRRVETQGRSKGWLFVKKDGRTRAQIRDYDALFLQYLELLRDRQPELFSAGTLMYMFSLRRSMRRGAVLATTGRVSSAVVNLVNRWRTKEGVRGSAPGLSMEQTYTNMRDAIPIMISYSKAQ